MDTQAEDDPIKAAAAQVRVAEFNGYFIEVVAAGTVIENEDDPNDKTTVTDEMAAIRRDTLYLTATAYAELKSRVPAPVQQ